MSQYIMMVFSLEPNVGIWYLTYVISALLKKSKTATFEKKRSRCVNFLMQLWLIIVCLVLVFDSSKKLWK